MDSWLDILLILIAVPIGASVGYIIGKLTTTNEPTVDIYDSDYDAIKSDWKQAGNDMKTAITKYKE